MKSRLLTAVVAVALTTLLCMNGFAAEPPGQLDLKTIKFVDSVPKDLAKPTGVYQEISKTLKAKSAAVGKEGKILFVRVENLNGLEINHASDCSINSQFQFKAPARLVDKEEYDELEDQHPVAKMKLIENTLVAWTRSRHAAPGEITYRYRSTARADVTLDRKALEAHRTAMANRKKATLVAQRK
jgi:hypothetical protein